ncbi:MAG TPA: hypothetical protein VK588_07900 [Chitinophagaceae bacterium]|nr:hypothetical protein [Chitinophagaceae bacterium]
MKTKLLAFVTFVVFSQLSFGQTNTIQVEDTNLISSQRWRDTCFGLIDKSATQIPSGYLIDYSLTLIIDSNFNSQIATVDTITNGSFFLAFIQYWRPVL